ncbi:unnamed protein product [Cladocopium goreaui]|uniref:Uncharacterized protein n=1 Tax=Cladocopium goreaui TaxID=2562237 RepID=A0A9P1GCD6_9DINO|nr:unnamed protein product [Cladocopium goreaui]
MENVSAKVADPAMKVIVRGTFIEVTEELSEVNCKVSKRWARSKSMPLPELDTSKENEQLLELTARLCESPKTASDLALRHEVLQLVAEHGKLLPASQNEAERGILFANLCRRLKLSKKRLRRLVRPTDFQLRLDLTAHKEAVLLNNIVF